MDSTQVVSQRPRKCGAEFVGYVQLTVLAHYKWPRGAKKMVLRTVPCIRGVRIPVDSKNHENVISPSRRERQLFRAKILFGTHKMSNGIGRVCVSLN